MKGVLREILNTDLPPIFQIYIYINFDSEDSRIHIINKIFFNKFYDFKTRHSYEKTFKNVSFPWSKETHFLFGIAAKISTDSTDFPLSPWVITTFVYGIIKMGVLTSWFTFSNY